MKDIKDVVIQQYFPFDFTFNKSAACCVNNKNRMSC